jgi:F420H(2)-dependent quinone reductase
MSFDMPAGTRGARQPRAGAMMRWVNGMAVGRIRRAGNVMGLSALVLTTVGAKTGAERSSPVGWFPGRDGSWLISASAAAAPRFAGYQQKTDRLIPVIRLTQRSG